MVIPSRHALIINFSNYDGKTDFPDVGILKPLPSTENDGKEMSGFLASKCGFKVMKADDSLEVEEVEKRFEKLMGLAKSARDLLSKAIFFVYYSGHGIYVNGETHGLSIDGKRINLDRRIRELARQANIYVVSFFDCCRIVVSEKSGTEIDTTPTFGQMVSIYASPPNAPAVIVEKPNGLSLITEKFLDHMKTNGHKPFPSCLKNWTSLQQKAEMNVKTTMDIQRK
jgi:hypothetical protein